MNRAPLSSGLVILVALLAAGSGWAAAGLIGGDPSRGFSAESSEVDFAWTERAQATTSEDFEEIKELSVDLCGGDGLVARLSAEIEGAPAQFRLKLGKETLRPGAVRFEPGLTGGSATSFEFGVRNRGPLLETLRVEWRSVGGVETVLKRGSVSAEAGPLRNAGCA